MGKFSDWQHGPIRELIPKWRLNPTFKVIFQKLRVIPSLGKFWKYRLHSLSCHLMTREIRIFSYDKTIFLKISAQSVHEFWNICPNRIFFITDLDLANSLPANWKKLEHVRGCHLQNPFPLIVTNMNLTHYTTGHITQVKQQRQG